MVRGIYHINTSKSSGSSSLRPSDVHYIWSRSDREYVVRHRRQQQQQLFLRGHNPSYLSTTAALLMPCVLLCQYIYAGTRIPLTSVPEPHIEGLVYSRHVEPTTLRHSQMFPQLPLCLCSLSKQRTDTN